MILSFVFFHISKQIKGRIIVFLKIDYAQTVLQQTLKDFVQTVIPSYLLVFSTCPRSVCIGFRNTYIGFFP